MVLCTANFSFRIYSRVAMARQAADETLLRSRGASPLQASLRNGGEKGLSDALLSPTTNVFGQDQNDIRKPWY